jgi:hypothetical protein
MASICFLAQSEGLTISDKCPNCFGKHLWTAPDSDAWTNPDYVVPYKYEGRTLWTYTIDNHAGPVITGPELNNVYETKQGKFYSISLPEAGFSDLCVFYDAEGDARINVVAAVDGIIVQPESIPPKGKGLAKGTDPNCPIESALLQKDPKLKGSAYPLTNFVWDKDQVAKWNMPKEFKGAWTTAPGAGAPKEKMVLQAKPSLPVTGKFFTQCRFLHWEFNPLTPTAAPPDFGDGDSYAFDRNAYVGLIAHYELVNIDADVHEPTRKPGEISLGDPGQKLFLTIGERRVAYEIGRLAQGAILPIRNDVRSAVHGSVLKEPRVGRDLRDRITRAARAATDLEQELRELLLQLPPIKD